MCSTYFLSTVTTQMNMPMKNSMKTRREINGMVSIFSMDLKISLYMVFRFTGYPRFVLF